MVQHLIAPGQPGLVQILITIVTVVTIEKVAAMLDVFLLVTGLKRQPARKVSIIDKHWFRRGNFVRVSTYVLKF